MNSVLQKKKRLANESYLAKTRRISNVYDLLSSAFVSFILKQLWSVRPVPRADLQTKLFRIIP